jgi:hypothetical protein
VDSGHLSDLIEGSDLDGLVRFIDGLCESRDWDGLVELAARCRQATERGKQVWAAAEFAEYRSALEAPAPFAAAVVVEGAGRFSLGPLWEVAASTHTWADLQPHLESARPRAMVAHERVIRGDDLLGEDVEDVLEIPLRIEPWEPAYAVATYRPDKADFPDPELPKLKHVELPKAPEPSDPDEATEALYDLARAWVEQSNGRVESVAVEGEATAAVAALGMSSVVMVELSPAQALAKMAWTAASGGAYGRRRGTPVGRYDAWWVVAAAAGVEWPAEPDAIGEAVSGLRWWLWDPGDQGAGWTCGLAIADDTGRSWAINAIDTA